jgi:hypothetical protein
MFSTGKLGAVILGRKIRPEFLAWISNRILSVQVASISAKLAGVLLRNDTAQRGARKKCLRHFFHH